MRPGLRKLVGVSLVALGLWIVGTGDRRVRGDEPSRFGRLFRLGSSSPSSPAPPSTFPTSPTTAPSLLPPPSTPAPSTPVASSPEAQPRLVPQPRNSRSATEADPILTRISIGRSDNGGRFGMFLQVFADGTVLDGEGIHHVGREALRPLLDAIQTSDAARVRGHCGAPATDFIEQVHVVVYERSLGRLRANAFSYSGNPQGCDHSIKHLQDAIDAFQNKLNSPTVAGPTGNPAHGASPASPGPSRTIPLTPLN